MLKTTFINKEAKYLTYCVKKNFSLGIFKEDLTENLISDCNSYDGFDRILIYSQLYKHVPKEKKWIRGNNKPHINKGLLSPIRKRLRL